MKRNPLTPEMYGLIIGAGIVILLVELFGFEISLLYLAILLLIAGIAAAMLDFKK